MKRFRYLFLSLFFVIFINYLGLSQIISSTSCPFKIYNSSGSLIGTLTITLHFEKDPKECGNFFILPPDIVLNGDILNVELISWFEIGNTTNQCVGESTIFHLRGPGQIGLRFTVNWLGGSRTYELNQLQCQLPLLNWGQICNGCTETFNYCQFYDCNPGGGLDGNYHRLPVIKNFQLITPNGWETVDANNNYGIFKFPYYFHVSNDCTLFPNYYNFLDDLQSFFNIGQSDPNYYYLTGHVNRIYYPTNVMPDPCKLYFQIRDSGARIRYIYNEIEWFVSGNCEHHLGNSCTSYVFHDLKWPFDASCSEGMMPFENSTDDYSNYLNGNSKSLNKENENLFLTIYPTVTDNILNIETENEGEINISIYNMIGCKVKSENSIYQSNIINISDLKAGIYLVGLKFDNKNFIRKIIKL